VLAGWATLVLVLVFAGAFAAAFESEAGEEAIGVLFMLFGVVPAIVGIALGLSSFTRGRKSALPWIGSIWNGLILGIWILLTIVGLMMG
jgi:hypothetical protein